MLQITQLFVALLACPFTYAVISDRHGLSNHRVRRQNPSDTSSFPVVTDQLPELFPELDSRDRVQIRYGPFRVPPADKDKGTFIWTNPSTPKPCSDCLVYYMKSTLEYEDGSEANIHSGMWLRNAVFSTLNKKAMNCEDRSGDKFFSTGNERSAIDLSKNGTQKFGYYFEPGARVRARSEIMNMDHTVEQTVYLNTVFEFISHEAGISAGFREATPLLLDVTNCSRANEVPLTQLEGILELSSKPWTSKKNWQIIETVPHMHDGGAEHLTLRNDDVLCASKAIYGETEAYISPNNSINSFPGSPHLSSMSSCNSSTAQYLLPGDELKVQSIYDLDAEYALTAPDRTLEPIMGVSWMWLSEVSEAEMPMADRIEEDAQKVKAVIDENRWSAGGVVVFVMLLIGGTFWLVRWFNKRRAAAAGTQYNKIDTCEDDAFRLDSIDRPAEDRKAYKDDN